MNADDRGDWPAAAGYVFAIAMGSVIFLTTNIAMDKIDPIPNAGFDQMPLIVVMFIGAMLIFCFTLFLAVIPLLLSILLVFSLISEALFIL